MIRPRIKRYGRRWVCTCGNVIGIGSTPDMAYLRWVIRRYQAATDKHWHLLPMGANR